MADVLELAHVAGKLELHQPRERGVGDALGFDAELACALFCRKKRVSAGTSSRALAQRRQAQPDHVEAVEQVLAERALRLTRSSRFWWVAAITRTLLRIGLWPPTR